MKRILVWLVFGSCAAIVASEGCGLAILWFKGRLNRDVWRDVWDVVVHGASQEQTSAADEPEQEHVSTEEVMQRRIKAILDLESREGELALLKNIVSQQADQLVAEQAGFLRQKKDFEDRLSKMDEELASQSVEQARGILAALPPADGVRNLMALDLDENVVILQGMPEKTVAKILQQFARGDDPQQDRGRRIFEAIEQGTARRDLVEVLRRRLTQEETPQAPN